MPDNQSTMLTRFQRRFRGATFRQRALPDFVVIGVEKGGTTSLYRYLCLHPNIFSPRTKEPHYFSFNYHRYHGNHRWYKSQFPLNLQLRLFSTLTRHPFKTFEASTSYISSEPAAKRLHALIPNAKLILLLRNPIDRAYSQHDHQTRLGKETLPFEEAIQQEEIRIRGEIERMQQDEMYYSEPFRKFAYLQRGIYIDQIKCWMDLFPREQFLILSSEDLQNDTAAVYRQILEFVGLPRVELKAFERKNTGSYAPMNPQIRAQLIEYFKPYNQQLYEYLGRDFGWDQ